MAVRNDNLGGTDFTEEGLKPVDFNDTVDAMINLIQGQAELAVRTLQANNVFVNGPNLVADEFVDSNGTKNTLNAGSTTSQYDSVSDTYRLAFTDEASGDTTHDPDSFTNPENAFDSDDNTDATKSDLDTSNWPYSLGKTFTSKYVAHVRVVSDVTAGAGTNLNAILQTYDGATWTSATTLHTGSADEDWSINTTYFLDSTVQGIRVLYTASGADASKTVRLSSLEYGDFDTSGVVVIDSNTTTLDGNELGFAISVPDSSFPTNTSMTVTVSDGTNSLSAKTIDTISKGVVVGNSVANGGPLSSGTLKLTFSLSTTDDTVTPTLPSYGVKILR